MILPVPTGMLTLPIASAMTTMTRASRNSSSFPPPVTGRALVPAASTSVVIAVSPVRPDYPT